MKNIIFTIVAKNYFASAITLAQSVKNSNPDCDFFIVLADEKSKEIVEYDDSYKLILAGELNIPRYLELAYKYDVTEFATAIKPFCIDYFQEKKNASKVAYIDPDIYVYEKLDYVFDMLDIYSAIVTPHILSSGKVPDDIEQGFLFSGTYNLGFFAVSNSSQGKDIVKWWKKKLLDYAFVDYIDGLYTDQKWMNLVTTEFDNVYVLRDFAFNVAWWNFSERNISVKEGKPFVSEEGIEKPVVFFHFSGFKVGKKETISKSKSYYELANKEAINLIYKFYESKLIDNNYGHFSKMPYAYQTYDNGIVITRMQRRLYRTIIENNDIRVKYSNPFKTGDNSYFSLLDKNGLIVNSKDATIVFANRNNLPDFSKKEKMLQKLLSMLKKIIGIQRYEVLVRYLSHSLEAEKQTFLFKKP